jgi:hypothetical protein
VIYLSKIRQQKAEVNFIFSVGDHKEEAALIKKQKTPFYPLY